MNPEIDDDYLTLTGSIGSIFNAASRILAGILYDIIGLKVLFSIILVLQFTLNFLLVFYGNSPLVFMPVVAASYACVGSYFVIFPTLCSKLYG